MTVFWVIAALLAVVALAFVLPPLLGRRRVSARATASETNVALHRGQLKELDADLAAGTLNPEQHDEARREIERRLLEDVGATEVPAAPGASRATAIVAGIAVPLAAILLYFLVGNPAALTPGTATRDGHAVTKEQIEGMVGRLAERLKDKPDDVEGWAMLGRTYTVIERFTEAAAAYANAVKRSPPDAQLLADYADALAMAQGRNLQGEPERLIAQALKVDPNNVKALALAGTVAFERKDFPGAIAHWERILKVLPPDSEMAGPVRESITEARGLAGTKIDAAPKPAPAAPTAAAATTAAAVSGTVRLSPALAAKAAPDDMVFIFARPATGSRMPLAAVRKRVRDLPAPFTLDDSMAMTPEAKLSSHAQFVVGARVSKSGSPAPQPGDLEGLSAPVKAGNTAIVIVIDREVAAAK